MGCNCKGMVARNGGNGAAPAIILPSGVVLIRYLGNIENGKLPASTKGGTRHQYGTERRLFYVDVDELSRVLSWRRNGILEFETVI